jgi:putative endonuclease
MTAPRPRAVSEGPGDAAARPWVLYLLECAGDRLYAGITNDLAARFAAHRADRGARFTKAFAPLRIVAAAQMASRSQALKAECALKRRPRADKLRYLASCGAPVDLDGVLQPPVAA